MITLTRLRQWNEAIDETVDYRALVPLRVALGPLVLAHLAPVLSELLDGRSFDEIPRLPLTPWYPLPPASLVPWILVVGLVGAVLLSAGLFTHTAAITTTVVYGWWLFLSDTNYHHNRAFLFVLLVGCSLVPVGASFSLDALRRRRRDEPARAPVAPRWPLMLLRFQIAVMYVASGVGKLTDPDWIGGTVTRLRMVEGTVRSIDAGIPAGLVDWASTTAFHGVAAPVIVLTEIGIGIGLLTPRGRSAAIWMAVWFHLAIAVSADVETFSYAALVALVVWVNPTGARRSVVLTGRGRGPAVWAAGVGGLDWLGRLRVSAGPGDGRIGQPAVQLTESGVAGEVTFSGLDAVVRTTALLPVTFLIGAPWWWLRKRGDAGNVSAWRSAA